MEELKPYMVEFNEDGTMKDKEYPLDCAVGGGIRRPIIVITHDECTFSANDVFAKPRGGQLSRRGAHPSPRGVFLSGPLLLYSYTPVQEERVRRF